jgi:hypothetical protein
MGDSQGDKFPILSRDLAVFAGDDLIEIRPSLELMRRELAHLFKQFKIVLVIVMGCHYGSS